ncbi:MAG TPA: hypothetical protein VL361_27670 [Candidatus Limnocylindrales bacterium]|nr:hypothetical protein [Candidatus Limnocylindrales bacterium]
MASKSEAPDASESRKVAESGLAAPWRGWIRRAVGPGGAALLLTLILMTIPRLPLGTDDDSSWSAVLDYAHQKGLQFGADISFSYGPLGFLITPYWSPSAPLLHVTTDIVVAFGVALGLCLVVWRTGLLWRCLTISMFTLLAANADPRIELLVCAGLLCWGLLCLVGSGPSHRIAAVAFTAFAVFATLTKMTLLFPAILSVFVVVGVLFFWGKTRLALAIGCGFLATFFLAWMGLGQHFSNLGSFLKYGVLLSAGYDQTMWAKPFPQMLVPGVIICVLTATVIALRSWTAFGRTEPYRFWRRALLIIWLLGSLFVIWKHGYVRGGRDHLVVFLTLAPTIALIVDVLPCQTARLRFYARGLGLIGCAVALLAFIWLFGAKPAAFLGRPFLLAVTHARSLIQPAHYTQTLRDLQEAERQANQLPRLRAKIGQASVDVFGCNQAYAVFNNLNYRPRPVFQSYAAYSAPLMDLNEQFYFSKNAPDSVLFRLSPIDDRFPALEDAALFRHLLINYQPLDLEGPFLYLKSKQQPVAPNLTLIREGGVHPGEMIGLKDFGSANIWLEIILEPSLLGQARKFLYHPSEIILTAWRQSGSTQKASFNAPAPMLSAGFLASPLLLDNRDVLRAYAGKPVIRPHAYSIDLGPRTDYLWNQAIRVRIYKIENQFATAPSPDLVRLLDFPGFETAPAEVVANKQNFITVAGQPVLFLPPDGFMRYSLPPSVKSIHGEYGFAPAAYVLGGATQGAEFRVEEELPDGSLRLLHSRVLRPLTNLEDRGLKPFFVTCPGSGTRKLLLRALPLAANISPSDVTCWSEIGIR